MNLFVVCPECGGLASYNQYFGSYMCKDCAGRYQIATVVRVGNTVKLTKACPTPVKKQVYFRGRSAGVTRADHAEVTPNRRKKRCKGAAKRKDTSSVVSHGAVPDEPIVSIGHPS